MSNTVAVAAASISITDEEVFMNPGRSRIIELANTKGRLVSQMLLGQLAEKGLIPEAGKDAGEEAFENPDA